MNMELLISVIGTLILLGLSINAFFVKSLVSAIQQLEVKMTTVTIQHDHTINDVQDNKARLLLLERESVKQRERLHSLEGGQLQVLEFIKGF